MELATASTAAAGASRNPQALLQLAIRDFQNILTEEQRGKLGKIGAAREAETVMIFTAQLDYENHQKKGRSISSRLYSVLQSVQSFATVVETFVSSHPEIAALVWGSVKLTLLIAVNFTSQFEALSGVFMSFSKQCPRFAEYQALYPASAGLQTALCDFNAAIIRCCKHAVEIIQRPWQQKLKNAILQSFEQELQSDVQEIQKLGKEVKSEIALAAAHAERQDQRLQALDREAAKKSRSKMRSFMPKVERGLDEIRAMHLQQSTRKSREEKLRLLDWLFSHDHGAPFREACKKRQYDTAEWIFEVPAFKCWHEGKDAALFWCSGKIGSGKTVLCANVVNHIYRNIGSSDHASFFFVHHDNAESLRAESIIRSIIRQSLDALTLSEYIENQLMALRQSIYIDLNTWVSLLQHIIRHSSIYFILIDGLDECATVERRACLDALESLTAAASNLRIFITSRDSLRLDLQGRSLSMQHVSMACDSLTRDIRAYIDNSIQERLQQKDLILGDPHLLIEIINTLTQHADGMFLWVTFLLDEICAGSCDAHIRNALENLPKSLEETYTRILSRISSQSGRVELIQKIFQWVAVAKRPLALQELREAVAIEIGQKNRREELLPPEISRAVLWCGNLLQIAEEEPRQVRFAHGSIHNFITKAAPSQQLSSFHIAFKEANHLCGELCVTYLHFGDFRKTIMRRQQSVHLDPVDIASTALSRELRLARLAPVSSTLADLVSRYRKATPDLIKAAMRYGTANIADMESFQDSYPFLEYAAAYWTSHTNDFQREVSNTWDLFLRIVTDNAIPASRPWEVQQYGSSLLYWSQHTRHYALFRHATSSFQKCEYPVRLAFLSAAAVGDDECTAIALPSIMSAIGMDLVSPNFQSLSYCLKVALNLASREGHVKVVEQLIKRAGVNPATALQVASGAGCLEVVEHLLRLNVKMNEVLVCDERISLGLLFPDIKTTHHTLQVGWADFRAACQYGHLEAGLQLLSAKTDVGGTSFAKRRMTALQVACRNGHLEVVERLLAANVDVNLVAHPDGGRTALQATCDSGDMEILGHLLTAGVDVTADRDAGRAALSLAFQGGHLELVERLLVAGVDVCAEQGPKILHTACNDGRVELVKLLIAARVGVNVTVSQRPAPLWTACCNGPVEIVKLLLTAGANIHALGHNRHTALWPASYNGHVEIVKLLLAAGAYVNASGYNGHTALWAACYKGRVEIVEILLAAGADTKATGHNGHTAFQAASQGGHHKIKELLLQVGTMKAREPML